MTTWIIYGVAAIVLGAAIMRLMLRRPERRLTLPVFDKQSQDDSVLASSDATEPDADSDPPIQETPTKDLSPDAVEAEEIQPSSSVDTSVMIAEDTSEHDPVSSAGPNSGATSSRSIFSDFRGIVQTSDGRLSTPEPEDLPIESNDLVFGSATAALAQMLPESTRRKGKQQQDLLVAGYHTRAAWLNLNSVRFVLALLALIVVGVALVFVPEVAEPYLLAALVGAPLLGWALPLLFVASTASGRRADIERGLPDVLDMLNMGVSQGLTVQSALRRIGPEISSVHPALALELRIVNQQARFGSLNVALYNFGKRLDSAEVTSFTSLLIQSEATGTSVSRALTDYSDSIRSTIRERADARSNAASFKLLFPTVLCLMPSVFMFLLGPAVVEMSDFFGGTANELLEARNNAINTLDLAPRVVQPASPQ